MNKYYGIVLTLIAGLFFLIGGLISKRVKDKNKLNHFSVSLALVIMFSLLLFDLIPELFELIENINKTKGIIIILIFVLLGFIILKILDIFIPDHHHDHHHGDENIKEHVNHINHIGTLTIISLILHNILEGFAIFGLTNTNLKVGILTSLSVALHNIPLGTHIFSSIDMKHNKILITLLTLSSLLGGIIFLIIGDISTIVLCAITSITVGMLIYIALLELLPEVITDINEKETIIGLIIGLILLICSAFI